jgi:hypothetical protein
MVRLDQRSRQQKKGSRVRNAHQCGLLFLMVIGQKAMIRQKNWFHSLLRCGGAQCAPYGAVLMCILGLGHRFGHTFEAIAEVTLFV